MKSGERIKALRENLNLTQKELSEKTGLTLRTIQRIENDEVKPSLYSLKVIQGVLGSKLSEIEPSADPKPYEFSFIIKINDMSQFISDLKILFRNNWKIIFILLAVFIFLDNYTDIKRGITDGLNAN